MIHGNGKKYKEKKRLNSVWFELSQIYKLQRTDIITNLNYPKKNIPYVFPFVQVYFEFFRSILSFLLYRFYILFVKFIPIYFYLAIVNGNAII